MPALDRDAILQALLARLQDRLAGDVKMFTRRVTTYHNAPNQPALCLLSDRHTPTNDMGSPPVWRMSAEILLYLEALEADDSPETRINALVLAVEGALERQADEPIPMDGGDERTTTLGGLCSSCRVVGVEIAQGAEAGQCEASITLTITAPAS